MNIDILQNFTVQDSLSEDAHWVLSGTWQVTDGYIEYLYCEERM
jgi:hypothetical protein